MSGYQQEILDVVKELIEKVIEKEEEEKEIEQVLEELVNNVVEEGEPTNRVVEHEEEQEEEWPEQVGGANLRVSGKVVKVSGGRFKDAATSVTLQVEIPRNMAAHPNGPEHFGQEVIRLILQNAPATGSQTKVKVGVIFESDELHESVGLYFKDIQIINFMDVVHSMEDMAQSNKSPLDLQVPRLSMRLTYITFPSGSGKRRYTHEKLLNELAFEKRRRGLGNGEDEDFEALHNNEDLVRNAGGRGFLNDEAAEARDGEDEEEEDDDGDVEVDEDGNEFRSGNVMKNNVSKDCLPHALYQALCYKKFKASPTHSNHKTYRNSLEKTDNQRRFQKIHEAVREMKLRAGVDKSTNFDNEDIEKFQNTVFENYQIVVFMDRNYVPYFQGPFVGKGKELYLSLEDQHYRGVRTLCALFKTKYYCALCQTGYRDVKAHYKYQLCVIKTTNKEMAEAATLVCDKCAPDGRLKVIECITPLNEHVDVAKEMTDHIFSPLHKGVVAVAHNASGYDGQFILENLIASNKAAPKICLDGTKVIYLKHKTESTTAASAAIKVFQRKHLKENTIVLDAKPSAAGNCSVTSQKYLAWVGHEENVQINISTTYGEQNLYPTVMKYEKFPIGPPTDVNRATIPTPITTPDGIQSNGVAFDGFVKCRVIPPRRLALPVLPVRVCNRLMFSLCTKCTKTCCQSECTHTDEERAINGTFTTPELKKALSLGFIVTEVFHAVKYDEWLENDAEGNGGLFTSYIKEMMVEKIWGKMAQRVERDEVEVLIKPANFWKLMHDTALEIVDVVTVNDCMVVKYRRQVETLESLRTGAVHIAALVTSYARLRLYDLMEKVGGERIIYTDTDSIVYYTLVGEENPLADRIGSFFGQLTDEISGEMEQFVTIGPKTYSYVEKLEGGKKDCSKGQRNHNQQYRRQTVHIWSFEEDGG
ncbi:hypothetical protein CAEBREN_09358 [Caenorhabditis brenneri]|uniref:DNA-directed DNA polymerase n=1 Tax=Caenorhabditis brenneri TaxID=135651 RepID=G0P5Q5_CAEBE|nr:hypothetical protein CAEBREN_09358 [Caenorhabditis brenneri]